MSNKLDSLIKSHEETLQKKTRLKKQEQWFKQKLLTIINNTGKIETITPYCFLSNKGKINRKKILAIKRYFLKTQEKNQELNQTLKKIKNNILTLTRQHLSEQNPQFARLEEKRKILQSSIGQLNSFLGQIDDVLDQIGNSKDMETLDLLSNNNGISALSFFENEDTKEMVEELQKEFITLKKSIKNLNTKLNSNHEIGGMNQIVFDDILDIGIFSLVTLQNLEDLEDNILELQDDIIAIKTKLQNGLTKITNYQNKIINQKYPNVATIQEKIKI